jgi:hypothetical protein
MTRTGAADRRVPIVVGGILAVLIALAVAFGMPGCTGP